MGEFTYQRMQDEMSRFEAEIAGERVGRTVIGSNTYNNVQHRLEHGISSYHSRPKIQVEPDFASPPVVYVPPSPPRNKTATVSSAPQLYKKTEPSDFMMVPSSVAAQSKPPADEPTVNLSKLNELPPYQPTASSSKKTKEKKNKKMIRSGGGQVWEDTSLVEWGDDDFRLFCGDLGNDVTDELLTRTFSKYASFMKAKVIRDKRTNKSKGFGFISFKEPADFIKAMKEMNGRYVGSRPIKLRKSTWKNRSLEVVRKKEKEKAALISLLTGGNKH